MARKDDSRRDGPDVVIQMDVNSPEWKARMEKLNRELENKYGEEKKPDLCERGYRWQM